MVGQCTTTRNCKNTKPNVNQIFVHFEKKFSKIFYAEKKIFRILRDCSHAYSF